MAHTGGIIESASSHLCKLSDHTFDLITISKPSSLDAAINLAKIISKLSPILGNLIEFSSVEFLNSQNEYKNFGKWRRQDPGFPDTIFEGSINPVPGFEIKTWFPLATEITARFKDSQNHFSDDHIYVCLLAWLPDHLIFGKPKIVDVCVISGLSVALARDTHYHNPPDYLILEPEDTTSRTRNLQQTNTNGYKWQGTTEEFEEAVALVGEWGEDAIQYQTTPEYQLKLRELIARYPYRLDTNFAKMNRIGHEGINEFKQKVLNTVYCGKPIKEWSRLIVRGNEQLLQKALRKNLGIRTRSSGNIVR